VQVLDAVYPGGAAATIFPVGSTAYVRAIIADPFGSYDVSAARLTLTDGAGYIVLSGQSMPQVADSGLATRTFEYAYAVPSGAAFGAWRATVIGLEGDEGTVTDQSSTSFNVGALPAAIRVAKSSRVLSDPVNGTLRPKRIPGSVQEYSITLSNEGPGAADAGSLTITDVLPAGTELFVATSAGDPVVFSDGSIPSGLTFSYVAHVHYSNQPGGAAPFTYSAQPDAAGFDAAITALQIAPAGQLNGAPAPATPSFTILFRVRVK
jgi:trimeric autotransporter adhesin